MMTKRRVAIFVFDDVEVLDFAGPFEVFGVTQTGDGEMLFEVVTVAETRGIVTARNGLLIQPNHTFETLPTPDILIVPGGSGTRPLVDHAPVIEWIIRLNAETELTASVCTGALLLAKAGLLAGLQAATYHTAYDQLSEIDPSVTPRRDLRFVDNGAILTSAGISAGIDMALYIVARLHGRETAIRTADHMEYDYKPHLPEG